MDAFATELAALAYRTLRDRQRGKSRPARVEDLEAEVWRHWAVYQKGCLAQEAARIRNRARPERLAELAERAWELLAVRGENWEYPDDESTVEEYAQFTAWAMAALRWLRVGPAPQFTRAELLAWLGRQQFTQLTLF
jgi:hypothetical protein